MRAGVVGFVVAELVAASAQAAGSQPAHPALARPARCSRTAISPRPASPGASASRRRQAAWHSKKRQHSPSRRHRHRAKLPHRQALLHHHRHHRRVAMNIPQNGRYVIRTQFAAFAAGVAGGRSQRHEPRPVVNFQLILASRQAEQDSRTAAQAQPGTGAHRRRACGNWPATPGKREPDERTQRRYRYRSRHGRPSGAALPSIADNSDFSDESVAITGQAGQVSAFAGMDTDARAIRTRWRMADRRSGPGRADLPARVDRLADSAAAAGSAEPSAAVVLAVAAVWRWWWRRLRRSRRRRRWRRTRQLPRLQSRAAPRRHLLERQQLGDQCAAVLSARPAAAAAGQRFQPLRAYVHERALYSAPHQAQRQRHGFPHAFRHAPIHSRRLLCHRAHRLPERGGDFSAAGLPPIYNPVTGQQFNV